MSKGKVKTPDLVSQVEQLTSSLEVLSELLGSPDPAIVRVRVTGSMSACYPMGNPSRKGLGLVVWDDKGLLWESGLYNLDKQLKSSNYREADNLVTCMEVLEQIGLLMDYEVFLFTNNKIFEIMFYKGHSDSEALTNLILRLRMMQQQAGAILHVIQKMDTTMKYSGIVGLSQVDWLEDMMKSGASPWSFLPLGTSAKDLSGGLVRQWAGTW